MGQSSGGLRRPWSHRRPRAATTRSRTKRQARSASSTWFTKAGYHGPMAKVVGRLAPTPSGHLHLGNALAFGAAWLSARSAAGRLILRVEDLDEGRARAEIAAAQRDDLVWLGLEWDEETSPQSRRAYDASSIPT